MHRDCSYLICVNCALRIVIIINVIIIIISVWLSNLLNHWAWV